MADGWSRLRINTQERAVSTDINRMQAFGHQDTSELLRHLLDTYPSSVDDAPGIVSEPSTIETPLRGEIFGGLMVKPQAGSLNLFVDAGAAMIMAPDAAADESNYKMVRDVGVSTVGALVVTSNGAGSARIDVVECRLNPTEAVITDNRDIFDTTSGAFVATSVTKELRARLEYRVRAGTAGSGFPGTVSGWMPLCVISAPAGAASVDVMTFWDVRPVLSDRAEGLIASPRNWPAIERSNFTIDGLTSTTELRIAGQVNARFDGRRLGGLIKRGSPGTDANYVDMFAAANQASGFAMPADTLLFYAYLLTPFGLPRWARYTDGPSGRVPRTPYGILVVSTVAPQHLTGKPSSAVNLPTSTGLGSSTSSGLCIAAMKSNGTSANGYGELADGGIHWLRSGISVATTSSTIGSSTFNLVEGTTHPGNAKAIHVRFVSDISSVSPQSRFYQVSGLVSAAGPGGLGAGAQIGLGTYFVNLGATDQTVTYQSEVIRIPIWLQYPTTAGGNKLVEWTHALFLFDAGNDPTLLNTSMQVVGWELGP